MPNKYTNKLEGKHVLIIGGSSGIGYGVAEASLEHGASVTISSSNEKRVQEAVESLKKDYPSAGEVRGFAASMGDEATLEESVKGLFEKTGKVDHVVFTAGDALALLPLKDASFGQMKQAGMVRFFAPLMVGKYAPQYLEKSNASSITITTGAVSERPQPDWTIVGAFATGIHGLVKGLALDLKPIRVNLVSPGAVKTALWDGVPEPQRSGMFKAMGDKTLTGQVGQVEDVAESFIYAMKDKNLSGATISTSGGTLLL